MAHLSFRQLVAAPGVPAPGTSHLDTPWTLGRRASAKLLSLQTPDFREELTQEQQLVPVLWTIGVLLGLNDRFEIENPQRREPAAS